MTGPLILPRSDHVVEYIRFGEAYGFTAIPIRPNVDFRFSQAVQSVLVSCRGRVVYTIGLSKEIERKLSSAIGRRQVVRIHTDDRDPVRALMDRCNLGRLSMPLTAAELTKIGQTRPGELLLERWLNREATAWVRLGRPALAAAIDAATILNIPAAASAIEVIVAAPVATDRVLHVATRRLSRVSRCAPEVRSRLGTTLFGRILDWEQQGKEEFVASSMVALLWASGGTQVDWIVDRLRHGSRRVAIAIAYALVDRGASEDAGILSSRAMLRDAAHDAWRDARENGRDSLPAALVWAIGALTDPASLSSTCNVLASAFCTPVELEDAAALRAGRILVRRFGHAAIAEFHSAFRQSADSFVHLLDIES